MADPDSPHLDAWSARQIDAFIDGELDGPARAGIGEHLVDCQACREALARRRAALRTIKAGAQRFAAPRQLRRRLQAEMGARSPVRRLPLWQGAAAAGLLSAAAAALATFLIVLPAPSPLDGELVAAHARSLMANHLTDVASSDHHTVKPWFNGRLDMSPPVPDLADDGFPLIGGRADYIAGRPAAALVYGRRAHIINLFTWPAAGADREASGGTERNGYNIVEWRERGMAFAAISDLNAKELHEFQHLWRSRAAQSP
jgi:anti-sigma factor RsiW